MKKTKIIFLTATALILSLCGIFFCRFEDTSAVSAVSARETIEYDFSLSTARNLEVLCLNSDNKQNLEAMFENEGYKNFRYFENPQSTSYNSGIAFGIGTKYENKQRYVLVVFRASQGAEWHSNFHIGTGINHAGFLAASEFSVGCIDSYLEDFGINSKNAKIIFTGHSRGGAVANLTAKEYTDRENFQKVNAYTFASPNTTKSDTAQDTKYKNIYNIQNPEDFVCFLPLESWGYKKYGTTISLPTKEENLELYRKMERKFMSISGYPHVGYKNGHKDIEDFILCAENLAPEVRDYYENFISTPLGDITFYGYLEKVAELLSGQSSLSGGLFILSSYQSPSLYPLTEFLTEGMSFDNPQDCFDLTKSAINGGHAFETYLAWLDTLTEDYFYKEIYG